MTMTRAQLIACLVCLSGLLSASPSDATSAKRCKRICRDLITSCIEANSCKTLPRAKRPACKRSCRRPLIQACRADANACPVVTTTTTTLPGSCPPYPASCANTGDRMALGLGTTACVQGQGPLPPQSISVFVSLDATDPANASVNANVTGSFSAAVTCTGAATVSGGSVTVVETDANTFGSAGCCPAGTDEQGLYRCKATITKVCDVNQSMTGFFEADATCSDNSKCSTVVQFIVDRDS